jgi:hypothetical protein
MAIEVREPTDPLIRHNETKAFSRTPVHWNEKNQVDFQDGMDLRDYFAASAMQALIAVTNQPPPTASIKKEKILLSKEKVVTEEEKVAKKSYAYADALLAERNKK